jgi:hypothetical protein
MTIRRKDKRSTQMFDYGRCYQSNFDFINDLHRLVRDCYSVTDLKLISLRRKFKNMLETSMQEFVLASEIIEKLAKQYQIEDYKELAGPSREFLKMHAQLCSEHSYLWRRK